MLRRPCQCTWQQPRASKASEQSTLALTERGHCWCASDSSRCKSVFVVPFFSPPTVLFSSLFSLAFFPRCTRGSSPRVSCCPFLPAVFCRPTALFSRPFQGIIRVLGTCLPLGENLPDQARPFGCFSANRMLHLMKSQQSLADVFKSIVGNLRSAFRSLLPDFF